MSKTTLTFLSTRKPTLSHPVPLPLGLLTSRHGLWNISKLKSTYILKNSQSIFHLFQVIASAGIDLTLQVSKGSINILVIDYSFKETLQSCLDGIHHAEFTWSSWIFCIRHEITGCSCICTAISYLADARKLFKKREKIHRWVSMSESCIINLKVA